MYLQHTALVKKMLFLELSAISQYSGNKQHAKLAFALSHMDVLLPTGFI